MQKRESASTGILRSFLLAFLLLIAPFPLLSLSADLIEGDSQSAETAGKELRMALLGDSMTWIGGENFDNPKGWTYYLADLPVKATSYARSGATWTNTSETHSDTEAYSKVLDPDNVIFNQALRLIKDGGNPDIILIYAGTNDAWFESRRPGMLSSDIIPGEAVYAGSDPSEFTTLASSIYLTCSLLSQSFPEAQIVLLTPVHSGKIPPERITAVSDMIEKTASKLGIPTVRGDKLIPFSHNREKKQPFKYTYDGVHSNPEGARLIADCIIANIIQPALN